MLKDTSWNFFGGEGKGDLEKSRFDWVFLNDGVPKLTDILVRIYVR